MEEVKPICSLCGLDWAAHIARTPTPDARDCIALVRSSSLSITAGPGPAWAYYASGVTLLTEVSPQPMPCWASNSDTAFAGTATVSPEL